MSNFGALTDHWGIATTDLILVDSSKTEAEMQRADALDENGDVAASQFFGNTAGTLFEASVTYALKSGTLAIATALKLGELVAGKIVESIEIATSNGAWPQITVSGKLGCQTVGAPTGKKNTYVFPAALSLVGKKVAQLYGVASLTQGKLTTCNISAKVDIAQQDSALGEPVAHAVGNGTGTVAIETVRVAAAAPALGAVTSGFTKTQGTLEEPQAEFHTSSFNLAFTLTRENAA